jgi:[ribosomal protein S18]-alanine N-acetyltransferase
MIDDLDRIMAVMKGAFDPQWGEAWNRRQVSDSLAFASTHYLLIDPGGGEPTGEVPAAGFTLVRAAPGEEELLLIGVVPEARGKGLGQALLRRAVIDAEARGAERLFLEMRANNPARRLYERFGFQAIGRRRDYYRAADGTKLDAITFAYEL